LKTQDMNSEWEEKKTPCLLYDVEPGKSYRVVLSYMGQWRPFFWFEVGREGDVYLGPRYEKVAVLQKSSQEIVGRYSDIQYDEGEMVNDPDVLGKGARISFHTTGQINFADDRAFRDSLRDLSQQELLCLAIFEHPSKWSVISRPRKRDVCLSYPIDETRPLWAQVYVAPIGKLQLVMPPSAIQQVNLLFECLGLAKVPDLLMQLVVGHGATGPWPTKGGIIFRHKPAVGPVKRCFGDP